jgi:hypothetical protein
VAQLEIDPAHHGNPTAKATATAIPRGARNFGFVPDVSLCKPGDLILSRSRKVGFVERQIVKTQAHRFDPDDARWTHAAIFLYADFIAEAIPGRGMITRSLYNDIPESILRVRRCPNLSDEDRYKIALCALRMLGLRYSTKVAISAGWQAKFSPMDLLFPTTSPTIVCSKVYYDAHVETTRRQLQGCSIIELTMPAHLSATSDLEDVYIPWLCVPRAHAAPLSATAQ